MIKLRTELGHPDTVCLPPDSDGRVYVVSDFEVPVDEQDRLADLARMRYNLPSSSTSSTGGGDTESTPATP